MNKDNALGRWRERRRIRYLNSRRGWFMGNGWLALVVSVGWFCLMYKETSNPPAEFIPDYWRVIIYQESWGSMLLLSACFCGSFVHTFIVRDGLTKTERVLFIISMAIATITTLMVYQWGMDYDLEFFGLI